MQRRVVITAEAAITPLGNTRQQIAANLAEGVSGVRALRKDALLWDRINSKVFGTIDYPIEFAFDRQFRKTMGPVAFYGCQVAKDVIHKSGIGTEALSSGRVGVAFGSTHGSPTVQRSIYETYLSGNYTASSVGAADYLKSMVHTTAVNITKMFGITGRVLSSCTACTTSSQSIGYGYEMVKFGLQDAMICGGADEYDTTTVAVFDNLLACSIGFNDSPGRTPRPFDEDRDGLVVAEGAGAVMLEDYEHARKRGAPILAEVVGFACTNNGGDLILPNMKGVKHTIEVGLESAQLSPGDVDFVSAHATATRMGDIVEAQAIGAVYGKGPAVTGFKGHMGHSMGACGVIETIFTLYLMQDRRLVPTKNLEQVDQRCEMVRHAKAAEGVDIRVASIQNFAFGGVNTCLFLKRFD